MGNSESVILNGINIEKLFAVYIEKYDWESKISFRNRADRLIHQHNLTVITGRYIVEFLSGTRQNKILGLKMWFENEEDAVLLRLSI